MHPLICSSYLWLGICLAVLMSYEYFALNLQSVMMATLEVCLPTLEKQPGIAVEVEAEAQTHVLSSSNHLTDVRRTD
jgi:hypothetical protein